MKIPSSLTLSLLFFVTLVSCPRIKQPPLQIDPYEVPNAKPSVLSVPIEIDIAKIEEAIWNSIPSPIYEGKTKEINAKILAVEKITERKLIKELLTPYQPGYYVTLYKSVEQKVQKAYKCAIKPWKWGECYKDVIEIVKVPYQEYIKPVDAVYHYVSQDITALIDKAFGVSIWFNYKAFLESFDLSLVSNEINTKASFRLDISTDYQQNAIPYGPDIKIKGLMACSFRADLDFNSNVHLGDEAKLIVDTPDDGAKITFRE